MPDAEINVSECSVNDVLVLSNVYAPNIGGVETHLDDLVRALSRRGWRVSVVSYRPLTTRVPWKRFEQDGTVRVWRLWWVGHNWFHVLEHYPILQFVYLVPRLFLGSLWWCFRYGRGVDVVHAHGFAAAFCARLLGAMFGKRVVVSTHAVYNLRPGSPLAFALRWMCATAHKVLTLSSQSMEECAAAGVPREKLGRFTYWVDLSVFSPGDQAAARSTIGIPREGFTVLFVGRLIAGKGVRLLLDVAARTSMQSVRYVFVGTGPMECDVRAAAGVLPNVVFAGPVANSGLTPYYRAADLLCVPSQYQEGFGRVIVESLACGTPVLGADCPGITEATSGDVAWLCEPTEEAWTERLATLQGNRASVLAKREKCRSLAEERYSESNVSVIERALRGEG